jgi:hypothetical protein
VFGAKNNQTFSGVHVLNAQSSSLKARIIGETVIILGGNFGNENSFRSFVLDMENKREY